MILPTNNRLEERFTMMELRAKCMTLMTELKFGPATKGLSSNEIFGVRRDLRVDLMVTPGGRIVMDIYECTYTDKSSGLDFLLEEVFFDFESFEENLRAIVVEDDFNFAADSTSSN